MKEKEKMIERSNCQRLKRERERERERDDEDVSSIEVFERICAGFA